MLWDKAEGSAQGTPQRHALHGTTGDASISLGRTRTGSPRHHTQPQAATGTGPGSGFDTQTLMKDPDLVCQDLMGRRDTSQTYTSFSAAFEFSSQGSVYQGRTQVDISMGSMRTSRSRECSSMMV